MKFSREVEHGVIAAIREAIAGKKFTQEDSHNGEKTEYVIAEITNDRYGTEPCLIARCFPLDYEPEDEGDTGAIEMVVRAGFLEI